MTIKTVLIAAGALTAAGLFTAPQAEAANFGLSFSIGQPAPIVAAGYRAPAHRHGNRHHQARGHASLDQIMSNLRRSGFVRIVNYNRHGSVYTATAAKRNGQIYTVRVSATNGRILSQQPVRGRTGHAHRR